jgi:hypothetical protein
MIDTCPLVVAVFYILCAVILSYVVLNYSVQVFIMRFILFIVFDFLRARGSLYSGFPPGMVSVSLTLVFSEVGSSPRAPPAVLAGELGLGVKFIAFDLSGGTVGSTGCCTGCTAFGSPLISLKFAVSVRK